MDKNVEFKRHRRLRSSASMRSLVRETTLSTDDLLYPIFVIEGENIKNEVSSMPGVFQFSLDRLMEEITVIDQQGIRAVMLFGIPQDKDEQGTGAFSEKGIIQQATRLIKDGYPAFLEHSDTCLLEYKSLKECGAHHNQDVDNTACVKPEHKTPTSQGQTGADINAPPSIRDGFVRVERRTEAEAAFNNIP